MHICKDLKKWGSLLYDILAKMQFKIQGYVDVDKFLNFISAMLHMIRKKHLFQIGYDLT